MRFGPSLNAFTSFDETVYMLQVPTDKPEVMEKAFLILEDWAHNLSFDPAEIDKERGVIVEEWRLGRGAAARMQDKQFPILLKGSRYAERLPIGKKESSRRSSTTRLKQFYTDWYRPDLMAVVAVGDFDKAAVGEPAQEALRVAARRQGRRRAASDLQRARHTRHALRGRHRQGSADDVGVGVQQAAAASSRRRSASTGRTIVERLYSGHVQPPDVRASTQKADPPFVMAAAGRSGFVRSAMEAAVAQRDRQGDRHRPRRSTRC